MILNLDQCEYVNTVRGFWSIFLDDCIDNLNIQHISPDMCQMNFNFKNEFYEHPYTTNAYVAGITTAHARMKLYNECLGPLSQRSVYCDTNSIKYTVNNTNKPLEYDDNLAGLKDELDGGHLTKFIATGPKSYAHIDNSCEVTTHIKGFTLNVRNIEKLSFENICAIIDGDMEKITVTNLDHFSRSHEKKGV